MNKYEERAERERKAAMRSGMTLWSAGLALVVVIFLILGLSSSAPPSFFSKGAIIVAILLRQLSRRLRTKGSPRAARPDPQSTLKLD
jgi:hypothetical protein